MRKNNKEKMELKIKEFGKPLFKSKGTKKEVRAETDDFFKMKWD